MSLQSRAGLRRYVSRPTLWLMLTPYLLGLFGLIGLPSLLALGFAFTEYNALTPPRPVGWANFARLSHDRLYWTALGNTLLYLLLAVPLRIAGALGLALLLRLPRRGVAATRTAVYLPTVIPDIAYALIWLISFNPLYGPVNLLLGSVGLPTPAWTIEPWPARLALVIMALWQLGEGFVVLLAATRSIPATLYEVSAIDGAGAWARFRYLTWPLLLPTLSLLTARDLILSLQATFVPSLIVTKGGPGYATLFIPLYTYWMAFDDLRFGYAAAVVWTLYGFTLLIVVVQYLLARRWQAHESY